MMKKNSHSLVEGFSAPQRQHITGLLIILLKQYRLAISNTLPLLVVLFFKEKTTIYVYYGIGLFLLIYTALAVLKYLNIKYFIKNEELIYQSGIFTKKKITIPFDKIMNIDYEQNVVQQILEVAKLKVETAGSNKEEIELYALQLDTINDIRTIIFENKDISKSHNKTNSNDEFNTLPENSLQKQLIFRLSMLNLLKSGLTANHLKTGLFIIAIIFSFGQRMREWSILGDYEEYEESIFKFMSTIKVAFIFIVIFLLISVIVSMFRQLITYFDLEFYRTSDGFYITSGLFNKRLTAVKDQKIQSISFKQNILRKLIGMYDFNIQKIGNYRHRTNIPGMGIEHVLETVDILYPNFSQRNFEMSSISPYYFKRAVLYLCGLAILIILPLFWFQNFFLIGILLIFVSFMMLSFYLKSKKMQYGLDNVYVLVKGGRFGTSQKIIPISKIQKVSVTDSPYQRRKNLRSLVVTDGGGNTTIPFLDQSTAQELKEYLIYQIEKI